MRQLRHLPFGPPPKGRQNVRWSGVCMQSRSAQHKTSTSKHALHLWGSMVQGRMGKRDVYVHDAYCKTTYAFCAFACCEHACSSEALTTDRRRNNLIATLAHTHTHTHTHTHLRANTRSTFGVLCCHGGWEKGTSAFMMYIARMFMRSVFVHIANMHVHLRH